MAMFACPRRTAQDHGEERGWFIIHYAKRTIIPGQFNPEQAYRMAWGVLPGNFMAGCPCGPNPLTSSRRI